MKTKTIKSRESVAVDPTPAAACPRCGGWTAFGGMSQHSHATEPVLGRIGCVCFARRPVSR